MLEEWGTIVMYNLGALLLVVLVNFIRYRDRFPLGYITPLGLITFYAIFLGTNSFSIPMAERMAPTLAVLGRGGHSTLNIVTVSEYVFNREMGREVRERSDSFSPDLTSPKGHAFILDIDLLAHEIAHQWWGTGVLVEEDSPWSSEGVVCYMAYKYVTEEFGSDISAVTPGMWRKRVNSLEKSYYYTNPEMLENLPEKQRQRYELQTLKTELSGQMPLQLMRAEELLGEDLFFARLSEIYAEYKFKSLSYEEFLSSVELSEDDLKGDARAGAEKETGGIAEIETEKDTEGIAQGEAFLDE